MVPANKLMSKILTGIEKEREEERKLEYQLYLQRQEEEQKIANLNAQVKNWFESRQIRAYLEALNESFIKLHSKVEPGRKLSHSQLKVQWLPLFSILSSSIFHSNRFFFQ
jgi:hypothetical protein